MFNLEEVAIYPSMMEILQFKLPSMKVTIENIEECLLDVRNALGIIGLLANHKWSSLLSR